MFRLQGCPSTVSRLLRNDASQVGGRLSVNSSFTYLSTREVFPTRPSPSSTTLKSFEADIADGLGEDPPHLPLRPGRHLSPPLSARATSVPSPRHAWPHGVASRWRAKEPRGGHHSTKSEPPRRGAEPPTGGSLVHTSSGRVSPRNVASHGPRVLPGFSAAL
eukprot:scaffold1072_cov356-Prasinococcus_capsulatus_cf.AAC.5